MRIWLDDIRPMPEGYDIWVKDAYSAIDLLFSGNITHISFDHDLGLHDNKLELDMDNTGYTVANTIEEMAASGNLHRITWDVHSANPVGRNNIEMAMQSAERFWNEKE